MPVVKLVVLTSANISLIFLKPTNVLHTSIERYVYTASVRFWAKCRGQKGPNVAAFVTSIKLHIFLDLTYVVPTMDQCCNVL